MDAFCRMYGRDQIESGLAVEHYAAFRLGMLDFFGQSARVVLSPSNLLCHLHYCLTRE